MNETETRLAESVRDAVNAWSTSTERSQQAAEYRLGPSDVGWCQERVRRLLDRQVPDDEQDWNKAFIGTWLGDGLEAAYRAAHPNALTQTEVKIRIEGATREYLMTGHIDLVDPDLGLVADFKSKDGLELTRRLGVSQQHRFQRILYALGAHQSGLLGDIPLTDVLVANIYYDRSGRLALPHVQAEPFSEQTLFEAVDWIDSAVYAYLNGEEAMKEPPVEVCRDYCGFYRVCRAHDSDVEGRIDNPAHLTAIEMVIESRDLESRARRLKNEAQIALRGVEGNTATHSLRWTQINGGEVSYHRDSYLRLDLRRKK